MNNENFYFNIYNYSYFFLAKLQNETKRVILIELTY